MKYTNTVLERNLLTPRERIEEQFSFWRGIYTQDGFELPSDEDLFMILPKPNYGFGWMTIEPRGMTISVALKLCKRGFSKCFAHYRDLESEMRKSEQGETQEISLAWFRNCSEADQDRTNLSADDLERNGVKGITVLERLLLEVFFFHLS